MSEKDKIAFTESGNSEQSNHPQFIEFDRHHIAFSVAISSSDSPATLIDFLKTTDFKFTLIGEEENDHDCSLPIVLPRVDPECVLAALKAIIKCIEKDRPVGVVIMITDDLNNEIEMYTDYFFEIAEILGVHAKRFYSPWY